MFAKESKHVIAWHISKTRLLPDAITTLRKAMNQTHDKKPNKIITDGLFQYVVAIKKVMGWNWKIQKKRHIIDSGIGKNAILERINREVKQRIKWFSTFQALEGAKAFFNLFFYHLNKTQFSTRNLT